MKKATLFIAILLSFATAFSQTYAPGAGYKLTRDNTLGAHFGVTNANALGDAGFYARVLDAPNRQVGIYWDASETTGVVASSGNLDLQCTTLTLNGSPFSAGGLWTSGAGSTINYTAGNVGIGTATTLGPLTIKAASNSDADEGIYYENLAGDHIFEVRNDKFINLTSSQPEFVMRGTIGDTTVPHATIQFRDNLGVATGSIYNQSVNLFLSSTTGKVQVDARTLRVNDGGFQVYDDLNNNMLFAINYATKQGVFGAGAPASTTGFTVFNVGTLSVGQQIDMSSATTGNNLFGLTVQNDAANAAQKNYGIVLDVENAGASGASVPIATVETGLAAGWVGAMMRVNDVSANGAEYVSRPRPIAQRNQTFNSSGWQSGIPGSAGTYWELLDSVTLNGATWATGATLIGQHATTDATGAITISTWVDDVLVDVEYDFSFSTNLSGATSLLGCRLAVNGTGIADTERYVYAASSEGSVHMAVSGLLAVDNTDIITMQCNCGQGTTGADGKAITVYGANIKMTPAE